MSKEAVICQLSQLSNVTAQNELTWQCYSMPGRGESYLPPLPQIRTCAINAYGSSSHGFAGPAVHRVNDEGRGKHRLLQNPAKRSPRKEATPAPTCQPFLPEPHHQVTESLDGQAIAGDAGVTIVATEFLAQCAMLIADRVVPVEPTPLSNLPECPAQAALGRFPLDHPEPLPGATPVVGEAEQVESTWPTSPRGLPRRSILVGSAE